MSAFASRAYVGSVVHKRLRPQHHAFQYRVFALCLDVDEIDTMSDRLWLFSRNRRNLLSFFDRDLGRKDGSPVGDFARALLADAGLAHAGRRVELLCYPRLLGFVFNPLSVYFCYDAKDRLAAIIYEVSNTFAERRNYVLPVVHRDGPVVAQACAKAMYVSPFTSPDGTYGFRMLEPGDEVVVGVSLRDDEGPSLKTHFRGARRALSDAAIVGLVARHPLMTFKVVAAIHFQALRLWLKRIPLFAHHRTEPFAASFVQPTKRDETHVR